ncbi:hypothetical protein ACF0H5_010151 [Mactra antiquata]
MNSFYITLMSDSSTNFFPDNTQCCFRTKLIKPIHLNKQEWEIALVELIVPSQVINITESEGTFYIVSQDPQIQREFANLQDFCPEEKGVCIRIPPATYVTPHHLIQTMDDAIKDYVGGILKQSNLQFVIPISVKR